MPRIVLSHTPATFVATVFPFDTRIVSQQVKVIWLGARERGHLYTADELFTIPTPLGVAGIKARPGWANDNRFGKARLYGCGATTANIMIDENMRMVRQGIAPPTAIPVVVASGVGPITGTFVPYFRWLDNFAQRVSPLSGPGPVITLTAQNRDWSVLPTNPLDDSVTHIQGLVDDGTGVARVSWTRDLGTLTVLDTVETLSLGEAAPPFFTTMPRSRRNAIYHSQQYMLGNAQFPERVFVSAVGELEHFEGLFVASDGEANVGFIQTNDVIMFGSFEKIYRCQQFSSTDITRVIERPDMGLVGADGVAYAHGRAIVPTSVGIYLYDGSWHALIPDRVKEWRREAKLFQNEYANAQGFYDPVMNVFTFGPVTHSVLSVGESSSNVWWVLDCEYLFPDIAGVPFRSAWGNDRRIRVMTTKAVWHVPNSAELIVVQGSNELSGASGFVYEENVDENENDIDELKELIVEPGLVMPLIGGFPDDGVTWAKLWVYASHYGLGPPPALLLNAGGEFANLQNNVSPATMEDIIEATPLGFEPTDTHNTVLEGCVGEALSVKILFTTPAKDFRFRGMGGTYMPGHKFYGPSVAPET